MPFTDRPADLVEDGFDLAVRVGPLPDAAGLAVRPVGRITAVVCAAPAYLERHGMPLVLEDLSGHALLVYGRAGRLTAWRFPEPDGRLRDLAPDGPVRFDDLEAIADAVEAGAGITWPCWLIADRLRDGRLVRLITDRPGFTFDVHALWPRGRPLPSKTRAASMPWPHGCRPCWRRGEGPILPFGHGSPVFPVLVRGAVQMTIVELR